MKPWTQTQLNQLLQQVIDEAKAMKIPISSNISPTVTVNKRTKSRFGSCKKVKGMLRHTYHIEISSVLLEGEERTIKEIMAHEILHTCPSGMNHGSTWKNHCRKMESGYGYRLNRTSTYQTLGIDDPRKEKQFRYKVVCISCGQQILRQRKSALTTETQKYRCRCGGKLVCVPLTKPEGNQ